MRINQFVKQIKISKENEKYKKASRGGDTRSRSKFIRSILTKEVLEEFIIKQNLTCNFIKECLSKKIKISTTSIIKIAKSYGIKTKGVSEQNSRKDLQKKRQKTMMKKYGVEHPLSKQSPFYKKRNKTVLERYGVSNVFQLEEVKKKSINTMIEKYGVKSPVFMEGYKPSNGRRSLCHQKIEQILKQYKIRFESEYGTKGQFKSHNEFLNREYCPIVDIFIKKHKTVIEIYSDTFHANPRKYKDSHFIKTWRGLLKAKHIRLFDKTRKKQIESFGVKVIEFWTSEIKSNLKKVRKKIEKELNVVQN